MLIKNKLKKPDFCKACAQKGALLFELLIAISIITIILAFSAQLIFVSLQSSKSSGEKGVGINLVSEVFEGVRSSIEEEWANVYSLTKSSQHYYPQKSNGKWIITAGDETVTLGGIVYTRYFTVDNVSRDATTRAIEPVYSLNNDDPSTQNITVTVSWTGAPSIVVSEYFVRWRNKVCVQTSWSGSGSSGAKTCPDASYEASTNITTGADLKLCSGGC